MTRDWCGMYCTCCWTEASDQSSTCCRLQRYALSLVDLLAWVWWRYSFVCLLSVRMRDITERNDTAVRINIYSSILLFYEVKAVNLKKKQIIVSRRYINVIRAFNSTHLQADICEKIFPITDSRLTFPVSSAPRPSSPIFPHWLSSKIQPWSRDAQD